MNIGWIACSLLSMIFLLFGIIFAIFKEKSTIFISGFNAISKEERQFYDQRKMSRDLRNSFFIWVIILAIGAVLSYYISQNIAIIAIIVWLIVFFKDVHLDEKKAFEKYKK